jgi:rare lipoprotein A
MMSSLRKGAFLLFMAVLFISCAPNRAMTKNSDGMTGHPAAAEKNQSDQTYAADDDFDFENAEIETAEKSAPVPAKSTKVKTPAKKAAPPVVADSGEPKTQSVSGGYQYTGVASWYGREFNGKKTASGERFNMNDLTAAHRTLPLGSVVMVKNMDNGKTVKVRINDRGPFKKGRILDLSYAAAKKLDMVAAGEANVGIKMVGAAGRDYSSKDDDASGVDEEFDAELEKPAKKKPSKVKAVSFTEPEPQTSAFVIQAGAFYTRKNAEKQKSRIEEILPEADVQISNDGDLYKVKIAGITSKKDAERQKKALSADEIDAFIVGQE